MKTIGSLLFDMLGLNAISFAKVTSQKTTIYFNIADYQLTVEAKKRLTKLLLISQNHPDFEVFKIFYHS